MGDGQIDQGQVNWANLENLPWANMSDAETFTADGQLTKKYYDAYSDEAKLTYNAVCDKNTKKSVKDTGILFNTAYSNYAGTFKAFPFWSGRFLSYKLLGWRNRAEWVHEDFRKYLDEGRMCPEGTLGYENFMPKDQDANAREAVKRMLTSMPLFHLDRAVDEIVFMADIFSVNFDSQRAKRELAERVGFKEINPKDPTNVYRNDAGDILVISRESISWSTAGKRLQSIQLRSFDSTGNLATVGAHFVLGEGKKAQSGVAASLVRKGNGKGHPLFEHADKIVFYIKDIIESDRVPGGGGVPLPLEEVFSAFGYTYSGGDRPREVADHFKRIAMDYEMAAAKWYKTSVNGKEKQSADIARALLYNASEQYYFAAAAYIAGGDFETAQTTLAYIGKNRRLIGIGREKEELFIQLFNQVDAALEKLNSSSHKKSGWGPHNDSSAMSGGSGAPAGGKSSADEALHSALAADAERMASQEGAGASGGFPGVAPLGKSISVCP